MGTIILKASNQEIETNFPSFLSNGSHKRCLFKPSKLKRDLSFNHSSFNSSFKLGNTRMISYPRISTLMLLQILSKVSIDSTLFNSQGRAEKAYGFEVKAPTGHKSITFPE